MKNKQKTPLWALALVLALVLTACSSGGGGSAPETPSPAAAESGAESQSQESGGSAGEAVTIRIMSSQQSENPEGPLEKSISDQYMADNPGVTIEYISVTSNELWKKITALAAAGDMPDMFTNSFDAITSADDLDICEDLNGLFPQDFLDTMHPKILQEATTDDGRLLFIPNQSMPAGLLYRTDWFEEEGLTPPETWEEFIDAAIKLSKDTDGDGKIDRYGVALMGTKDSSAGTRFQYIMRSFGARELYRDDAGQWATDVGGENFKKAIQMFADLDLVHGVTQPGVIETSYGEAASLLVAEKAAMMITGSNALGTIYDQNPDLKGKLGSCLIPRDIEHASSARSVGYSIHNGSDVKEACKDYLLFALEEENLLKWVETSYRVPVRTTMSDNPMLKEADMAGFVECLDYGYEIPKHPGFNQTYEIIGSAYQSLLTGSADIDTAAANAQKAMEEMIESYR